MVIFSPEAENILFNKCIRFTITAVYAGIAHRSDLPVHYTLFQNSAKGIFTIFCFVSFYHWLFLFNIFPSDVLGKLQLSLLKTCAQKRANISICHIIALAPLRHIEAVRPQMTRDIASSTHLHLFCLVTSYFWSSSRKVVSKITL